MARSASIADQVSKLSLILTTLKTGADQHMYNSVSAAQRASIETQMRSGSLSIIDLSVVLEAVNPSSFADDDKKSLETTIAELCMKATAPDGAANFQNWENFWEFLPAAIWDLFGTGEFGLAVLRFLKDSGLRSPSEPTFRSLAMGLLLSSEGFEKASGMSDDCRFTALDMAKSWFRRVVDGAPAAVHKLNTLPASPALMKQHNLLLFQQWYGTSSPTGPKFERMHLASLCSSTRCRQPKKRTSPTKCADASVFPGGPAGLSWSNLKQLVSAVQADIHVPRQSSGGNWQRLPGQQPQQAPQIFFPLQDAPPPHGPPPHEGMPRVNYGFGHGLPGMQNPQKDAPGPGHDASPPKNTDSKKLSVEEAVEEAMKAMEKKALLAKAKKVKAKAKAKGKGKAKEDQEDEDEDEDEDADDDEYAEDEQAESDDEESPVAPKKKRKTCMKAKRTAFPKPAEASASPKAAKAKVVKPKPASPKAATPKPSIKGKHAGKKAVCLTDTASREQFLVRGYGFPSKVFSYKTLKKSTVRKQATAHLMDMCKTHKVEVPACLR